MNWTAKILERMNKRIRVRLFFEWRGGKLWAGNDAARARFGVGTIEDKLPLSHDTLRELEKLSAWHDKALNWENPADHGPWSKGDYDQFDAAARRMLNRLQSELGPAFDVVYEP